MKSTTKKTAARIVKPTKRAVRAVTKSRSSSPAHVKAAREFLASSLVRGSDTHAPSEIFIPMRIGRRLAGAFALVHGSGPGATVIPISGGPGGRALPTPAPYVPNNPLIFAGYPPRRIPSPSTPHLVLELTADHFDGTAWIDQAGDGNNGTPGSTGPSSAADGTNYGGVHVALFDASGETAEEFTTGIAFCPQVNVVPFGQAQNFTMAIVGRASASGDARIMTFVANSPGSPGPSNFAVAANGVTGLLNVVTSAGVKSFADSGDMTAAPAVMWIEFNGLTSNVYVSSTTPLAETFAAGAAAITNLGIGYDPGGTVGASYDFLGALPTETGAANKGSIADVRVWNGIWDATNRNTIINALGTLYGITIS